jgi:pimeloyl-ACP methyl ester carboxylesterase
MPMIQTKQLRIDVRDSGPKAAFPLLLLHGWPDDASAWDKIAPLLNSANFRTIVPMCRGFGKSHFLSATTPRTGNVGILALDAIELMDALSIRQFFVAGHDWGSNIAEALAVGWPNRVGRIAMISTPSRLGGLKTPPFEQARRQWYHWFQATERGAEAVKKDPKGFAQIMWKTWSPKGCLKQAQFDQVAQSFRNPDWVSVTLHSYRSRWGEAAFDPRSLKLEAKIKATRRLAQPMIFVHGEKDGVTPPKASQEMAKKFRHFRRIVLRGVGHFPPREAPTVVAKQLIRHFSERPAN